MRHLMPDSGGWQQVVNHIVYSSRWEGPAHCAGPHGADLRTEAKRAGGPWFLWEDAQGRFK